MSTGSIVVIVINLLWFVPFVLYWVRLAKRQAVSREHRRRLLESGRPASAVVLGVEETGPYYGRIPHLVLRLRVSPPGEPEFDASARGFFRQIDFPSFQPKCTVEVRFDPGDRATVAVVGDQLT